MNNPRLLTALASASFLLLGACGGSSGSASEAVTQIIKAQSSVSSSSESADTVSSSSASAASSETSQELPAPAIQSVAEVAVGEQVVLQSVVSDALADVIINFEWSLVQTPPDSSAQLQYANTAQPSFTPDVPGVYQVALTIGVGELSAQATAASVTAFADNIDITEATLARRGGNCTSYQGTYYSQVTDIQRSLPFSGSLQVSVEDDTCTFSLNQIPNHDFNDASAKFASDVSEVVAQYTLPVNPQFADEVTPLQVGVKNVIFLNGVTADLLAAACYGVGDEPLGEEKIGCGPDQESNPWRYDPMSPLNYFGTDAHNAHPQPDGSYHYHGNPRALFELECSSASGPSPLIGFAADGFPVFGPCIEDTGSIRAVTSSYRLKNDGGERLAVAGYETPEAGTGAVASGNYDGQFIGDYEYIEGAGDLDECNGMTYEGQYGYYVTDAYPWILGCFRAAVDDSFMPEGQALENLLHGHDIIGGEEHIHTH
ncbi:YHYH protein [Gilvimarinus sp. DA14]|uniref:YHYH protein n=1 Tax=Gilvimarinus sp. DA14 TaxID=2956798 RepID=UPI0020B835AE|nr:YHYH protein [Gilvimarinus sp. DA14]UTF61768.1 YHYH protein [Gilvimarinus sp. DA14]